MRHQRSGKKLGRDAAHRKALYANLTGALIEHGRIKTTVTKAKAVKPIAEQMITLGRRGDLHARRQAVAFLRSKDVVHKLFTEVAPQFEGRPGGYLRIVKLGPRPGDAAEMAYLELVDSPLVFKTRLPLEDYVGARDEGVEDDATPEAEETAEAEAETAEAEGEEVAEDESEDADPEAEADVAVEEPSAEAEAAAESEDSSTDVADDDAEQPESR
jgi:large subunit ribosomal protein L17